MFFVGLVLGMDGSRWDFHGFPANLMDLRATTSIHAWCRWVLLHVQYRPHFNSLNLFQHGFSRGTLVPDQCGFGLPVVPEDFA